MLYLEYFWYNSDKVFTQHINYTHGLKHFTSNADMVVWLAALEVKNTVCDPILWLSFSGWLKDTCNYGINVRIRPEKKRWLGKVK